MVKFNIKISFFGQLGISTRCTSDAIRWRASARRQASGWNIRKGGRCGGRLNAKRGWPLGARGLVPFLFLLTFPFFLFFLMPYVFVPVVIQVSCGIIFAVFSLLWLHLLLLRSRYLFTVIALRAVSSQQITSEYSIQALRHSPLLLHSTTLLSSGLRTTQLTSLRDCI